MKHVEPANIIFYASILVPQEFEHNLSSIQVPPLTKEPRPNQDDISDFLNQLKR
jgi:hypothetical protein